MLGLLGCDVFPTGELMEAEVVGTEAELGVEVVGDHPVQLIVMMAHD